MEIRTRRFGVVLCAGAVAAALTACSSAGSSSAGSSSASGQAAAASSGGAPVTVSIGVSSLNASHMWEFVATDQDIFAKYGVNLKLNLFQGASEVVPSMLGGSTDIAEASAPQSVAVIQKQPGLEIVFGSLMGSPLSLVAKKGITSLAELKGKTISVNAAGASADYYGAVSYLSANGINPSEVHFVTGGATSARVAALLSGAVDAVLCSPPDIERLTAAGDKVLGSLDSVPSQKNALAYAGLVKSSWASANRSALVKFLEGFQATQMYIRDPANRATVEADIEKTLNTTPQGASDVYTYFVQQAESNLSPSGAVSTQAISLALKAAHKAAVPDGTIAGFYTNTYVQQAAKVTGAKTLGAAQ
jgi:ABC-type nitrate/sulfonate/bicarbonate transport system substrate-binding protein